MYKILVINLGSTSTKVAYYEDDTCVVKSNIEHPSSEIKEFLNFWEQDEYRTDIIENFMKENNIDRNSLDVVVSRGGHTKPLEGGVYKVDEEMLRQQASGKWGQHPCDLGSKIAYQMSQSCKATPLIVDPPITDEFEPVARLSGHPLIERRSSFHALSHKATAKRYAREYDLKYENLNLIVVHLGGGISVAPHKNGRMIDGDNGLEGDGPFSTNRTGALPVGDLVRLCFSGKYTYNEVIKMLNGKGGLMAYLGTADCREVEERAVTDEKARLCLDAMIYQVCKQIGSMAAVLQGKVDAILVTGGIAHSKTIVQKIKDSVGFIAPIVVYPGENEMESLARGALEALRGESKASYISHK
ncbi:MULTISPECIES: butyrate kinase [unclassified Sedimentibacter]|uniref:butyrate kinase n=1 Tax=unclassified Sedimentibacter TaxID=2649220 RepID=UPI0027E1201B|nr:butyrate kinase [Sedimentibacter sp. MB35-C1]WMJ78538.1 butyrate kinase [Sedimentibacter sp. MB35-C1]